MTEKRPSPEARADGAHRPPILLIGWDGADWKVITPLLDAGLMPSLQGLIEAGVMGNVATLDPPLSPMLWTSIATGKRADQHGILGFTEPSPEGDGIRPVTTVSRRVKAFWNILHQRGRTVNVVGWWPGHPAEPVRGAFVSNHYHRPAAPLGEPWPMPPGTVHPEGLERPLAELRVHPGELEAAHLLPFVPDAASIDQKNDRRLAVLAKIVAECTSVHGAATWLLEHRPADVTAVYYSAIDHFSHAFMAYHPPRRPEVSAEDFERYAYVVRAAYRYHDMMLGRLLDLAGPDATVILLSDHGFHSDHLRPRAPRAIERHPPASWHRPYGILCLRGPGIRRDERIYGANLLDVCPTLLTLAGLPVGEDMEGRVLRQAFEVPPAVEGVPSWEAIDEPCGRHAPDAYEDPWTAPEALQQLVDLGYLEPPDPDVQKRVAATVRERRYHLARVHLDAGRPSQAAELLETLRPEATDDAERRRYTLLLAHCRHVLGERDACRDLAEPLLTDAGSSPRAALLLAAVAVADGRDEEALVHLRRAEEAHPRAPHLHNEVGRTYLRLDRLEKAESAFFRALEIDPEDPHGYLGLARAHLRGGDHQAAADAALRSVGLLHFQPHAHLVLGLALARLGELPRARLALEIALEMAPDLAPAQRALARLEARQREASVLAAAATRAESRSASE